MAEILVLGGTGKTGRRLTQRLRSAGQTARPASRHGDVPFDWDDPATHDVALAGAEAVYVVPPALRLDHAPLVAAFLARARALGVRRAVFLSARGVDQAGPGNPLFDAEQALRASGLAWTVLRPSWFMQNFTEGFFAPGIAAEGVVVAPAGDGPTPFVDAEDIAAVAAAALTEDGHAGEVYELSGPEALTHAEAAAIVGEVLGRDVRYVDADPAVWEATLVEQGHLPADYAAMLGSLFAIVREGWEVRLSDGVQRALGREPGGFRAFAERERAAWEAPVDARAG
jgi:uncharacterized protein YbjT (DUF2867 family)